MYNMSYNMYKMQFDTHFLNNKYNMHNMQNKYAKYAKYAVMISICTICTPHFADERPVYLYASFHMHRIQWSQVQCEQGFRWYEKYTPCWICKDGPAMRTWNRAGTNAPTRLRLPFEIPAISDDNASVDSEPSKHFW